MRLLKTKEYRLIETNEVPNPFPQYAILSHTWISPRDEITYQDFKRRKDDIDYGLYKQKGWKKFKKYCDRAAKDGWEWAWMDTCCIDKTNPADTQEAINAMFRWYQNAGVCYAYLEDVDANEASDTDMGFPLNWDFDDIASIDNVADRDSAIHKALRPLLIKAKWFTRGWTLQELLAPPYLVFVDRAWRRIGTRESWADEIKEASRIEARYLTDFSPTDFVSCSLAKRLSWASRRETTIEEDETYSLLGLFGISLPLIYGEGRWRAFNRLQRELITVYNDDSIFAWKAEQSSSELRFGSQWKGSIPPREPLGYQGINIYTDSGPGSGILAPSIREYWDASNINAFGLFGYSFNLTNRGLEINAKRWKRINNNGEFRITLACGLSPSNRISIPLKLTDGFYDRIHVERLDETDDIDENWQEDREAGPTIIRSSNHSKPNTSSLFALDYPQQITVGGKYFVRFEEANAIPKLRPLDGSFSAPNLGRDELITKPNHIIFINIELQGKTAKSYFDVVINLGKNGFPSVGIYSRAQKFRERLGNPLEEEVSSTYEHLAEFLHFQIQRTPAYRVIAVEESEDLTIGISLLPRPPIRGDPSQPSHNAKLREYVVKITVKEGHQSDGDMSDHNKRRRVN